MKFFHNVITYVFQTILIIMDLTTLIYLPFIYQALSDKVANLLLLGIFWCVVISIVIIVTSLIARCIKPCDLSFITKSPSITVLHKISFIMFLVFALITSVWLAWHGVTRGSDSYMNALNPLAIPLIVQGLLYTYISVALGEK